MFARRMGKLSPPNVKVGLTGAEARVMVNDLRRLVALLDLKFEEANVADVAAIERVTLLAHQVEGVLVK